MRLLPGLPGLLLEDDVPSHHSRLWVSFCGDVIWGYMPCSLSLLSRARTRWAPEGPVIDCTPLISPHSLAHAVVVGRGTCCPIVWGVGGRAHAHVGLRTFFWADLPNFFPCSQGKCCQNLPAVFLQIIGPIIGRNSAEGAMTFFPVLGA